MARELFQGGAQSDLEYAGEDYFRRERPGRFRHAWLGLAMRIHRYLDPVYAEYRRSTQSQNRPTQRADFRRWQAPRDS